MSDLITSFFGSWEPFALSDEFSAWVASSGSASVPWTAFIDWPYLFGVLLFAICLISVFKLIGVVIKR